MKKKKSIYGMLTIMMAVVLSVSVMSFEKNDTKSDGAAKSIVGLWELTHVKGTYEDYKTGKQIAYDEDVSVQLYGSPKLAKIEENVTGPLRFEFTSKGKCRIYTYNGTEWKIEQEGSYSYDGKNVAMSSFGDPDIDGSNFPATVKGKVLVLEFWGTTGTFKKLK